jgi:hypothetical protein
MAPLYNFKEIALYMVIKKRCVVCGKMFQTKGNQITCGKACYHKNWRATHQDVIKEYRQMPDNKKRIQQSKTAWLKRNKAAYLKYQREYYINVTKPKRAAGKRKK